MGRDFLDQEWLEEGVEDFDNWRVGGDDDGVWLVILPLHQRVIHAERFVAVNAFGAEVTSTSACKPKSRACSGPIDRSRRKAPPALGPFLYVLSPATRVPLLLLLY